MYRYRENYKNQLKNSSQNDCVLCKINTHLIVKDYEHATIIKNKFPYDIWEHRNVVEHLMIVPKTHSASLYDLPKCEQLFILDLIGQYEKNGYDIYTRSFNGRLRSIPSHQHTHLIKTAGECAKLSIYIKKPYVVAKF